MLRPTLLLAVCAATLVAEPNRPAPAKIQRGFQTLSNGSWEQAFHEWNEDGSLSAARIEELRLKLGKLGLEARTIGDYTAFHPPLVQSLWQRHWAVATFDGGAAFFCFDFAWHKGEWRLFRLEVSTNPQDLLPNLDEKTMALRMGDSR